MSVITEELKANAEVYYGDELGQEMSKLLLEEIGLPRGLLPLKDIIECGYVKEIGFVWLKQRNKIQHCFEKIGRQVSYDTQITAYVENLKIKKLTGVKAKELLMWLNVSEIYVDAPTKLVFKTPTGFTRTFPYSAFEETNNKEVTIHSTQKIKTSLFGIEKN